MADDMRFSKESYEVKVGDYWVFIKVSDEGKLLDYACSCKKEKCEHGKQALSLIKKDAVPLHILFKNSFWKHFFFFVFKKYPKHFEKKDKYLFFKEGQRFFIKTKNPKIKKILEEKEDCSIKFSSMTFDEIQAYTEKKASEEVLFEMSFFSSIAKELFLASFQKDYTIKFSLESVEIDSLDTVFFCDMQKEDFKDLIASIATVESNWKIFRYEDHIKKIFFRKNFQIEFEEGILEKISEIKEKGEDFFDWTYVEKWGFIEKKEPKFLKKDNVTYFLEKRKDLLQRFSREKIFYKKPKYELFFDKKDTLHILTYFFDKKEKVKIFKNWIYIENKGFCKTGFFEKHKKIKKEDVSEFVTDNKIFLQNIKNFEIHSGIFQEELSYKIENGDLEFFSKFQEYGFRDFKRWVYVDGKGFFEKKTGMMPIPFRKIRKESVSFFISKNKKDLETIPGFFLKKSPIKKMGLIVKKEKDIVVFPKIDLIDDKKNALFYDQYVYADGFYEMFKKNRIPKEYRKKTVVDEETFIKYELEKIQPYIVFLDPRLKKPKDLKLKVKSIEKKGKKYLMELFYVSKTGSFNAKELFSQKKNFYVSKAGLLFLKEPRFQWIKRVDVFDKIELSVVEWFRLSVFEDVELLEKDAVSEKFLKELSSFKTEEVLDLSRLKATLWPYQKMGVQWLWFLYCYGISGILCDEMGLGKTLQALGLLAGIFEKKHLVVCPTSVIYHWEDLIKKFLPDFKVCVFHGPDRKIKDCDILLTSYGILRVDIEKFPEFEVAIFDELQIAKNKNSKTNKILKNVKAKMRLGLTGTPIENRLIELKALFDVILPFFMPKERFFKEYFVDPIEKDHSIEKRELLKKFIRPFILRRKKEEVLLDLPEKVETVIHCGLSFEQKNMYQEIGNIRNRYLKELKEKDHVNYIHIFAFLSKLKQICDHPVLINKDFENYYKYESSKFDLFKELVAEALESSKKVVVFSQYLGMLDIMKRYLEKKGIKYAMLTGETLDRIGEIEKFKKEGCSIFLASLLAAGLGIDLTCASMVILYDRWWNPAKENQAIDRVHRIGQNRGVIVYKLVTKKTVEERIDQIIEEKKYLLDIVGKKEGEKLLSKEELIKILEEIG